jgi:acyl-CoA reductase-like NAD-dependent aldehyde dehydrogenase
MDQIDALRYRGDEAITASAQEQRLLIGGEWLPATQNQTFSKVGFTTRAPLITAAAANAADAARAADAAGSAFASWSATPAAQRAAVLETAAVLIEARTPAIAEMMVDECGATAAWCAMNCKLAADMLRHAATLAWNVHEEVRLPSVVPGLDSRAVRQAAGVVVGIAPWNSPVILGVRAVATPLAFGNTVVLKASEECPRTHGAIARAIADAGAPPGVINLLTNAPEDAASVVQELISHPAVRRINFTGSTKVGRIIAAKAAEYLKPTLLELGGKAPLLVLADADLDQAAAATTFGGFLNSGQICMSTDRVIVDRSVAADFEAKLAKCVASLNVGNAGDPSADIGPVINAGAAERIRGLIEDARAKGARLVAGGDASGDLLITPTILADITPDMWVYRDESFGPLVTIIAVDDAQEAVTVANDTDFGLSAAVFGRDVENAAAVGRRLQSGMCHINGATVHDEPEVPFGGVKYSGWGRFGGDAALQEFTELRWVTVQNGPRQYQI